jgi:hypothetical protein
MRRAAAAAVLAAALALAGAAAAASPPLPKLLLQQIHPGMPFKSSGSVIGEGTPLKVYASIDPTVHLFGDTLQAKLAVVADRRWVDPARLRVTASFKPYTVLAPPKVLTLHVGRFEQLTWVWKLDCLSAACVPVSPSEQFHVFSFPAARVDYMRANGKRAYGLEATWPRIEVVSQVSPAMTNALVNLRRYDWRYQLAPVAAPTFRVSPMLLFWIALGLAGAMALATLGVLARWYRVLRPRAAPAGPVDAPALEKALALLAWAHAHGDETLQRKAFERVASELGLAATADDLARAAQELAWSQRVPDDDEVETFAEQARQGREG